MVRDGILYIPALPGEHVDYYDEASGKGLKKVIGIVAGIAISFIAGPLGAALASSFSTATGIAAGAIGNAIGGALVGAAGNAGVAALTGGNVGQAALLGGLGGGLSGYMQPLAATGATNAAGAAPGVGMEAAGTSATIQTAATQAAGAPLSAALPAAAPTAISRISTVVQRVGGELGKKLMDADTLVRIATLGVSAAMAGGSSDAEKALIAQRAAELADLKQKDEYAYNLQMQEAKKLLQSADAWDPQRYGLAAASDAQAIGDQQEQNARREIAAQGGGRRTGEAEAKTRQIQLGTARNTANAFHNAFQTAQTNQNNARVAGINAIPKTTPTGYAATGLSDLWAIEDRRRQDTNNMVSGLSGIWATANRPREPDPYDPARPITV